MTYFKNHANEYDDLIIWGNLNAPEVFVPFYDPDNICDNKCIIGDWSYGNPMRRQLFAIGYDILMEQQPADFLPIETIYYPNGVPAFSIGEFIYTPTL